MEVRSENYASAEEISRIMLLDSDGTSDETMLPEKKKNIIHENLNKARAQALVRQKMLLSPQA